MEIFKSQGFCIIWIFAPKAVISESTKNRKLTNFDNFGDNSKNNRNHSILATKIQTHNFVTFFCENWYFGHNWRFCNTTFSNFYNNKIFFFFAKPKVLNQENCPFFFKDLILQAKKMSLTKLLKKLYSYCFFLVKPYGKILFQPAVNHWRLGWTKSSYMICPQKRKSR